MNSQAVYAGLPTLRMKLLPLFEKHGRAIPFPELAERFGCTSSNIRRVWEEWLGAKERKGKARCFRCGLYEWNHNPVWNHICLWCRADLSGIELQPLVIEWGWEAVITAFRETL